MRVSFLRGVFLSFCFGLFGCAHSFYYLPEIKGEGATHGRKGGVVYAIPPAGQPELTMRIRSLGIHKTKKAQMLGIRMTFLRPNGTQGVASLHETIDPNATDLEAERLRIETILKEQAVNLDNKNTP